MRIDDGLEWRVRQALHWAVKRRSAELGEAVRRFDGPARLAALALLLDIVRHTSTSIWGRKPTPRELDALAVELADSEAWSSFPVADYAFMLKAVHYGRTPDERHSEESLLRLALVAAASLLASRPQPEGRWWFDYLDRVEAEIEASAG